MKRLSFAIVIAVATAALGVGVASAHTKHFSSTVTINFTQGGPYSFDTFSGNVNSNKPACEKNRTVKVKRRLPGPDSIYGVGTTNASGHYSISNGNANPGNYYAKAKKKVLKKNSHHKHVCDGAKSPTINVPS